MSLRNFLQLGLILAIGAGMCASSRHPASAESLPLKEFVTDPWGPRYVAGAMDGIRFVHEEFRGPGSKDVSACRRGWPDIRIFYDFKGDIQSKAYNARDINWYRWEGLDAGAFETFLEFLDNRCVKRGGALQPSLAELSAITGLQYFHRMSFEHSKLYTEGLRDGLSLAALRAGSESDLWRIAECPDRDSRIRPWPSLLLWIVKLDTDFLKSRPPTTHPFGRNVAELMYEYLVEKCPNR